MKAYTGLKHKSFTILTILLVFLASACSLTRQLKPNESLVRTVVIKGVDKEFSEAAPTYVDKQQQPNNWINLQLYLMFSKHGKKDVGEPPSILDSSLVDYSRLQLEKFLKIKGYLKAKVTDSIVIKKKKATLYFTAVEGPMFRIRSFKDSIPDPNINNIYHDNRTKFSHIQPGKRFDQDSLAYDREQIYTLMKKNGYYDFYRQYIVYTYDTTFNHSVADIKMTVNNPEGRSYHPVYRINNTLVTISNSAGRTPGKADTLQVDSQLRYVDFSHRFKPKAISYYLFQNKGELYNIDMQSLTTSRLSELNVFRNVPNPTYVKLPDSTNRLDTKLDLVPLKRMSDRVEGEFLFAGGRYGYNLGNTFTNRNLLKRAEILQLKLSWSVLFDKSSSTGTAISNQDFKAGANLVFPRLVTPFNFPVLGKYGVPHTTFSTNYSLFYQKDLVKRQSFVNTLTYEFAETGHKIHTFTPIDIEFSTGTIDPNALVSLTNRGLYSYIKLIGRTVFSIGSQYAYQVNGDMLNSLGSFEYFRGSLDMAGNTLSLLTNVIGTKRDTSNERTILGHAFAQYTKAEADYRIYRNVGGERQFVFRFNPGVGVPYGNSDQLVFEKNFYAGGANDNRAWLPRTLGPGQFNRAIYGSDTLARRSLKYLDQFGEIKIMTNAEYRFKIADNFFGTKLKGAFFMDMGNIWRLRKETTNPNGEFRLNNLWASTAIGIGSGFRFDLGYFIFRLDAAFKFKDPQFNGADQWVLIRHANELFKAGEFKNAYRLANITSIDKATGAIFGDTYNFMQLNFGIGLPF